jgi:hypothetical protein
MDPDLRPLWMVEVLGMQEQFPVHRDDGPVALERPNSPREQTPSAVVLY